MAQTTLTDQIADELRKRIASGELPPGEKLPSEAQIGEEFGVSRITVRRALDLLQKEGLILARTGIGRIVRKHLVLDTHPMTYERLDRPKDQDSYIAAARAQGREPSTQFEMRVELPPADVAQRLKVGDDELVCVRQVTRYVNGDVWALQLSYYPMDVANKAGLVTPHDVAKGTVRAMSEAGFHEVGYVDVITARVPTPQEARDLEMEAGTALIVHTRTTGAAKRPVRCTVTRFPADRNRLIYQIDDVSGIADAAEVR